MSQGNQAQSTIPLPFFLRFSLWIERKKELLSYGLFEADSFEVPLTFVSSRMHTTLFGSEKKSRKKLRLIHKLYSMLALKLLKSLELF